MGRKEEEGLKLDSGLLGLRWNEAHLLRWIKNLQQVHAFRKQIWKSHFVHLIKFIDFSLSFSLFLFFFLSFFPPLTHSGDATCNAKQPAGNSEKRRDKVR